MRIDTINNILDLIGNTPLYKIDVLENNIYLKLEKYNFTGSSKDRAAKEIILNYLNTKKDLYNGLICVTSFNLGLSLAILCQYYRINLILIMNNNNNLLKMRYFRNLNIKILNYPNTSFTTLNEIASKLSQKTNYYNINQFNNELNIKANMLLGSELNTNLNFIPDYIFCPIGSAGTLSGIKKYFKEKTKLVGVFITDNCPGMNNEFVPSNLDDVLYITVKSNYLESIKYQRILLLKYGLLLGLSSGACFSACKNYIVDNKITSKNIVCICPDGMDRYLDD